VGSGPARAPGRAAPAGPEPGDGSRHRRGPGPDTLSEAGRLRDRLYDPAGVDRWASAILTNVHLRWLRQRARDAARTDQGAGQLADDRPGTAVRTDGDFDVETELERRELAELPDRAMGLLPRETSQLLIQRFADELPIGELAGRLGLSTGAVRMRLHRGKAALRQVLTTTCRDDALAYGLIGEAGAGPRATSVWCPHCGSARLRGSFGEPGRRLEMACPLGCEFAAPADGSVYGNVKGVRPALKRGMTFSHEFFRDRIRGRSGPSVTLRAGRTPGGLHEVWVDRAGQGRPRITTTLSAQALSGAELREEQRGEQWLAGTGSGTARWVSGAA
jgi:RNA polymerase sigma factor (sigma-70 family)